MVSNFLFIRKCPAYLFSVFQKDGLPYCFLDWVLIWSVVHIRRILGPLTSPKLLHFREFIRCDYSEPLVKVHRPPFSSETTEGPETEPVDLRLDPSFLLI